MNRVTGQVNTKQGLLDAMQETLLARKEATYALTSNTSLKGLAYTAAKERIDAYALVFAGIDQSIEFTKQADLTVVDRLGAFDGMNEVSEQKLIDQKNKVMAEIEAIPSQDKRITMPKKPCAQLEATTGPKRHIAPLGQRYIAHRYLRPRT